MSRLRRGSSYLLVACVVLVGGCKGGAGGPAPPTASRTAKQAVEPKPTVVSGPLLTGINVSATRTAIGTFIASSGAVSRGGRERMRLNITLLGPNGARQLAAPQLTFDRLLAITHIGVEPCVSLEAQGVAHITCLSRKRWRTLQFTRAQRKLELHPPVRCWRTLCVLAHERDADGETTRRVFEWNGDRWVRLGRDLPHIRDAVIGLGSRPDAFADAGAPIAGVVEQRAPSTRRVLGYTSRGWVDKVTPSRGGGWGPLVVGPVATRKATYMTVTDSSRAPWRGGVIRWGSTGAPRSTRLDRGSGDAQGEPAVVGDQLWVAWKETRPHRTLSEHGLRSAEFWVAQIDPQTLRVRQRRRIWTGDAPFAALLDLRVVDVGGRPHALWVESEWRSGTPSGDPADLTQHAILEAL